MDRPEQAIMGDGQPIVSDGLKGQCFGGDNIKLPPGNAQMDGLTHTQAMSKSIKLWSVISQ